MGAHYSHLDKRERTLLKTWHGQGLGIREMGRRLNRHHSTISRELRRNLWCGKYYYITGAEQIYAERLRRRSQRYRLNPPTIRAYAHQKLIIGWTQELIAGRLKASKSPGYICHESIYQYIYKEAPQLICCLARKHQRRRCKIPYRRRTEHIKNRVPITMRPADIDSRQHIGHWESDSVVGGDRKAGLNVIVERASRLVNISLIANKTAHATKVAIVQRLSNHRCSLVKSITYTIHQRMSCTRLLMRSWGATPILRAIP